MLARWRMVPGIACLAAVGCMAPPPPAVEGDPAAAPGTEIGERTPEAERIQRATGSWCEHCNEETLTGHECGISHPCSRCGVEAAPNHVHGKTSYCWVCNEDVGIGHSHGVTHYCATCDREAGANHLCEITRFCEACRTEIARDHAHGRTTYCPACRAEVGAGHECGKTRFCQTCGVETAPDHVCPE